MFLNRAFFKFGRKENFAIFFCFYFQFERKQKKKKQNETLAFSKDVLICFLSFN